MCSKADAAARPRGRGRGCARGHGRARGRAGRDGWLRGVRDGARPRSCFAIPDGIDDGTALALLVQGTTAWHLYRTAGRVAEGESVVVHSAAGGVGSLAVQLGHAARRGARDRDRLERGASASSPLELGRRRGDRPGAGGVDGAADRGQRRARAWTSCSTWPAARCSRPPTARSRRSGGSSCAGSPPSEPNRVSTGSLLRHSRAVVGFYLFHCLQRPGMFARRARRTCSRGPPRGELRAVVGGTYPLGDAAQAHDRPARAAHDGQAAARPGVAARACARRTVSRAT